MWRVGRLRAVCLIVGVAVSACGGSNRATTQVAGTTARVTTSTLSDAERCTQLAKTTGRLARQQVLDMLSGEKKSLLAEEARLNDQLNAAISSKSPDVGTLNAEHQAVLRELADIQLRIELPDDGRGSYACLKEGGSTSTPTSTAAP
jgi:hypothetical protein